jgi:glutathione S-transferase
MPNSTGADTVPAQLTLYHCLSARSFRPLWTLEEMGLPYRLAMLPFPPRVRAKEYLAINPLGTIPTLLDGPLRMTESAAICHYLATRYGPSPLAVAVDEPDYGVWLNWLYFSDATLTFPQTLVLRYSLLEPAERRQPQVAEDYRKWFLGRLRIVESTVAGREFLAAGRFTAADIAIGYALMLAETLKLSADFGPAVRAYFDRLKLRPGFQSALASQERAFAEQGIDPATRIG